VNKFQNNYDVPEKERVTIVHTKIVKCDNDHPVVYYEIGIPSYVGWPGDPDSIECGYCGMKYVYKEEEKSDLQRS
jgi:uncharacterized Zn-finger protein